MKWLHRILNAIAIAAPVVSAVLTGPLSPVSIATGVGVLAGKLAASPAWVPPPPSN